MAVREVRIGVTNETTPDDMDRFFTNCWRHAARTNDRIHLVIDTTQCSSLSLRRAMSIKGVLDKHRATTRVVVDRSTILVRSALTRRIIRTALWFVRTERPVRVELAASKNLCNV